MVQNVKQFTKLLLLMSLVLIMLVGCSNNEEDEGQTTGEEDNNSQETSAAQEEEDGEGVDESAEDTSDSNDDYVEHQEGLKMGETGVVEDNNKKYEVTLNSIEYVDVVGDFEAEGDTYAVSNITVTNIDDHSFNAKDIYRPGFGPENELDASLNQVLLDNSDRVDQDLLEGEIAPGEDITGVHVFDIERTEDYVFALGGSGVQIRTYAQWEISDSEIE
ncbi:hypothetical protein J2Z83_000738 [Virgibacillus natechei]|uniref:DUF4352 domain-containing protein n=1 Tax=Virgibacillus natechei TaxID=1216297 RepID=A0ABS4IE96_9BACI|nr:hypothetical protein [Virgibacillus natechei]MBP1968646.1 hypothetical protein [Virgibacillus natechei]UZD13751.1 DUF4352 domain-containing protein [Virgibacillus natechei]